MNKKDAFNIAYETIGLAELAAVGEIAIMECDSIIRGLVESSPKVLAQINDWSNLSDEVREIFDIVGVKLDEK